MKARPAKGILMKTSRQLLMLVAVALAAASCGKGGEDGDGGDGDTGGAGVIFLEDFSGPFPIPDWTLSNPGAQGAATIDAAAGSPPPSLLIAQPGPTAGNLSVATKATFAGPPLTVSAQMAFGGTAGVGLGTASIVISDPLTPSTTASVVYDVPTNTISFSITGTSSGPIADPGGFPAFTFSVDATGSASWSLNNSGTAIMTKPGFPSGSLAITLNNSSNVDFRFDNVRVSAP